MKKVFLRISVLLFILIISSCADNKLVGLYPWKLWKQQCEWKDTLAIDYTPDSILSQKLYLNTYKNNIHYQVFAGYWCKDSEKELPRLMKLFTKARIGSRQFALYGVNKSKDEPHEKLQNANIIKVPTLIIMQDFVELGRIVEHPNKSWEEDILEIINTKVK